MPSQRTSRSFTPSLVDSLEARVVLNGGGYQFPAVLGPVTTLGYSGKFVLTSRTYSQVQNEINRAFQAFSNQYVRAYQHSFNNGLDLDTVLGTVPGGLMGQGPGQYTSGLLGQIDRIMARVEGRLPYGRGLAGTTGGVGLSTQTIANATSNVTGWSVAEHLDSVLNSDNVYGSAAEVRQAIEFVRQATLNVVGNGTQDGVPSPGFLAAYVQDYGPGGNGQFGLRNSGHSSHHQDPNGYYFHGNNGGVFPTAQARASLIRFGRR